MKHRIVLVGCGTMAKTWLEYALARADTEIVALVDVLPAQAEKLRQAYHLVCPIYSQLEPAILEQHANLVFDVTIPDAHEQVVINATRLGCAVFGEKPMASSIHAAQTMLQAATQHKRLYAVMQNKRYNPQALGFQRLLEQLGSLGQLNANFFLAPHFGGFRETMQSPLLLDMAIHTFDLARFFAAADAVSVYCHEFNPSGSWYAGNAAAVCIFEMSNGSVFTYNGSWCAEGLPTSWEAEWRAIGAQGSAIWDGANPPHAQVLCDPTQTGFQRDIKPLQVTLKPTPEGHFGCLDEMFWALEHGRKPQTDSSDNIKSLSMVFAALESAKTGTKVRIMDKYRQ
jgi:predicted dehydrogenase